MARNIGGMRVASQLAGALVVALVAASCTGKDSASQSPGDGAPRQAAPETARTEGRAEPLPPAITWQFMEPVAPFGEQAASDAGEALRQFRLIDDPARVERLRTMADNEAARFAVALYTQAWQLAAPEGFDHPTLFIGVEMGGNYARAGFELVEPSGSRRALPGIPYLLLGPRPARFERTLLHESGHAIQMLLAGQAASLQEAEPVAPIPHSTAAVTDRHTAYSEGFAIHLEAINAHCGQSEATRAYFQRRELTHGGGGMRGEYYAPVVDFSSYSQNFARYQFVRDGLYAFEPAAPTQDYLRVQLDTARDRRTLRSPGAMVASEGVVATLFFQLIAAHGCSSLEELVPQYAPVFAAIYQAERTEGALQAVPVLEFLEAMQLGDDGERAVDVWLDITKGVTVGAEAGEVWAAMYDSVLHVDRQEMGAARQVVSEQRRQWKQAVRADITAVANQLGPVVVMEVVGRKVGLRAFGELQPLTFDINAAGAPMLRLIPGITEQAIDAILAERRTRPFASAQEFFARTRAAKLPPRALIPATTRPG